MEPSFLTKHLRAVLSELPAPRRYWVAYSGGPDSHALLHALAAVRVDFSGAKVSAVHVNHGLQREAVEWETHCRDVCANLQIVLRVVHVNARPAPGESPEAGARRARYAALANLLGTDEMVLTAHHTNDQAETLLLQLFRGAGPHGLAAMPECVRFGQGWLARPLLGWTRGDLQRYVQACRLDCISDLSNYDRRYDRNFLRHQIFPRLRERWPSLATVLARASRHQADAADLVDTLAQADLDCARGPAPDTLSCRVLESLSAARCRNVLRRWIRDLGLPLPGMTHLEHVLADVLGARADGEPMVCWPGAEVRRYRNLIYVMPPQEPLNDGELIAWRPPDPLILSHGRLEARAAQGRGLRVGALDQERITVRFRRGGERCRPAGRDHTHALKKLLQEKGVPPWRRGRLPLIYAGEDLAAVADLWVCYPFAATPDEAGWLLRWTESEADAES